MAENRCNRSHAPAPPQISSSESATSLTGHCDDGVDDLWLQSARVLELDLDRPELVDVRLEDCDVSGVLARNFIARRLELTRTRVRGVTFANGQCDDGLLQDCVTSELSLRFSRLRRVVFRDCDLSGADFYSVNFLHVTIERCNLQRARFDGATIECLTISDCNFSGVGGALSLKGATVDATDLPSLAGSLAREAGIAIYDD